LRPDPCLDVPVARGGGSTPIDLGSARQQNVIIIGVRRFCGPFALRLDAHGAREFSQQ
jgi:hypothetical protein